MIHNCIIDNLDIAHLRHRGVRSCRDSSCRTIENDVISHNSIRDYLDTFSGLPDDIALNDIDPGAAAIYEDTRILPANVRIVDNVITDRITIRAELDFDAIVSTVAGTAQMMDIIAFHQSIGSYTRTVMDTNIHPFSLSMT